MGSNITFHFAFCLPYHAPGTTFNLNSTTFLLQVHVLVPTLRLCGGWRVVGWVMESHFQVQPNNCIGGLTTNQWGLTPVQLVFLFFSFCDLLFKLCDLTPIKCTFIAEKKIAIDVIFPQ